MSEERKIDALARDIAERRTGMPAYLVDDETWAAARAEADATYEPPAPLSPLQEAIRKARGHLTGDEVVDAIKAWNRGRASAEPPSPVLPAKSNPTQGGEG